MNNIIIKGRLTKDPELRKTTNDISVCSISVAVDRAFDKTEADFFDCVFWRQGAEFVSKYFNKGQEILVSGEMQSRRYEDKDGNKRTTWEVQNCRAEFCGSKKDGGNAPAAANDRPAPIEDDDFPF